MKKRTPGFNSVITVAMTAVLLLTACDAFNVSIPEYLEEYTTNAAAESWRITTGSQTGPASKKNIIPPANPAEENSHTLISVRLRNPKKYQLELELSRFDTGTGEYISVDEALASASQMLTDYITITIKKASVRDEFRFRVGMKTQDGLRTFAAYDLPLIRCNITPASPDNLEVRKNAGTPTVYWDMTTSGDYIDVNEVAVHLKVNDTANTINTYVYTRTETDTWKNDEGGILAYNPGTGAASLAFPSSMILPATEEMNTEDFEKYYNFAVILKNSDGLEARNATPGFGWEVSPIVSVSLVPLDTNPFGVKVSMTAQDGSLKADKILYTLDGDSTVRTYTEPFEASIGTELVAWSIKSGWIPSRKNSITLKLDTVVFVNEGSTATADDSGYGFVPALPAPTIEAALDLLKTADSASSSERPRYILLMSNVTSGNSENTDELVKITDYGNPLVIQPADNDEIVLELSSVSGKRVMNIQNIRELILKNLTVKGGSLSNAGAYGHGILLESTGEIHGTLTLDSCTVTENDSAGGFGGGIAVWGAATLNIRGNTQITNNGASNGGGIYNRGGTVNIENGKISNNGASMGGGIYNNGGTVNIENAVISENNADQHGGGICIVAGSGSVTLNGGTISGNTASGQGGGVYVGGDTFNMSGGLVTGNTAPAGGGVYVAGGSFNMSDGKIGSSSETGRNKASDGGGVYVEGGSFNMSGNAKIAENTIDSGGSNSAGVYVSGGTFSMQGGAKVDMNNPVYLKSGKTITLSGDFNDDYAIAKIQPETYGTDVRVLDGDDEYIADNHTSFAVEDQKAGDGSYLSWVVNQNGYLVKAIGISCEFVDGIYGLSFTADDAAVVDRNTQVSISVNKPNSLPSNAGLSYTVLIDDGPGVPEDLSANTITFNAPDTAGQHTVFVEIIVTSEGRITAYSGSFVLTVRMRGGE